MRHLVRVSGNVSVSVRKEAKASAAPHALLSCELRRLLAVRLGRRRRVGSLALELWQHVVVQQAGPSAQPKEPAILRPDHQLL